MLEESLDRHRRVLELGLFAAQVFLAPDEALQGTEILGTGVHGKLRRQDVLLEEEDGEGLVLEAAAKQDLVVLALVAGELQVEIKNI